MSGPGDYEVTQADVDRAIRAARAFGRSHPPLADEFESAAIFAVAEAARRFDPARGFKFSSYADRVVQGRMKDCARDWRPQGYKRSRDAPTVGSLGDFDVEEDVGEEVGWDAERVDTVAGLARRLPDSYRAAFVMYHAQTPHMKTVGRALGLSESRISQILQEAAEILAAELRPPGAGEVNLSREIEAVVVSESKAVAVRRKCPDCSGVLHAVNNRCYKCRPGRRRAVAVTVETAGPERGDLFDAEIDAVRRVREAIAGLPDESAAWVLAAAVRHRGVA